MARAVILAGGRGTRLQPYTFSLPKPLMPIGDKPILEIIVGQLAAQGIEHITLAVNYQAEILRAYFADGSKWKIRIDYSLETEPLSTMGPLKLISNLPDNFLVLNGDVLTDLNYAELIRAHTDASALFTISAAARTQKIDFGVLEVDDNQRLCGFREKPSVPYLVSMGVYCLHRSVLDWTSGDPTTTRRPRRIGRTSALPWSGDGATPKAACAQRRAQGAGNRGHGIHRPASCCAARKDGQAGRLRVPCYRI
jgi:NDP-sugar pyrophosphorylase family protein